MTPDDLIANHLDHVSEQGARDALAALLKHGPLRSLHETLALIREEVEELAVEVRRKPHMVSRLAVERELQDIAAVTLRALAQMRAEREVPRRIQRGREDFVATRIRLWRTEKLVDAWAAYGGAKL